MGEVGTTRRVPREKKIGRKTPDIILLILVCIVVVFGVVMVYSASSDHAMSLKRAPSYFAIRQLMFGIAGIIVMIFIAFKFDYHICTNRKLVTLFYIGSLALAASVKFIGVQANGAKRWINIFGIQFQPSEILKLAVILMITAYTIRNRHRMNQWLIRGIAWLIVGIPALVVTVMGKNLSSGIVIFGIGGFIIFATSPKIKWYFILIIVGLVGTIWIRQVAINTPKGEPPNIPVVNKIINGYRLDRIRAWIDPFSDPSDKGYQPIQSLYAVGSGGIFGKGLGKGVQKRGFLPEPYNDIIFAVICEELGLVGALLLMLAYIIMVIRGMIIAMRSVDYTGAFIALGISGMVGMQALINVAVNTNTMPPTGMQLPLVSYGGTALVVLLVTLGLLLNVSSYCRMD